MVGSGLCKQTGVRDMDPHDNVMFEKMSGKKIYKMAVKNTIKQKENSTKNNSSFCFSLKSKKGVLLPKG